MKSFARYFDRVICLSMPQSTDRRAHIEKHFGSLGIEDYRFFDAVGPDAPEVLELYNSGRVATYPPCFRCGELTCGKDDCNNVLVPQQVATCVSFLRLWRHILDEKIQTAMIVEDDVVFADYARKVAEIALSQGTLDETGIRGEEPALLRMGWPACEDHNFNGQVTLHENQGRDSNHCFAVNKGMCQKLLDEFRVVDTTADIYTHRIVGAMVRNFTLQPPLATDLSYSFGAVDSLIHPKQNRVQYLKRYHPDQVDKIAATEQAIREHVKHITYRPLLALGHPGCGAGYVSVLLKACGLDVGHDAMGKDGISSWMFVVEDDENPFARDPLAATRKYKYFGHIIHFVRDPRSAIPSIISDDRNRSQALDFRRKHILEAYGVDLSDAGSEVEQATLSYLYWNKMIQDQNPDLLIRVEDAEAAVLRFLKARQIVSHDRVLAAPPAKSFDGGASASGNMHLGTNFADVEWAKVNRDLRDRLNDRCRAWGYEPLDGP